MEMRIKSDTPAQILKTKLSGSALLINQARWFSQILQALFSIKENHKL